MSRSADLPFAVLNYEALKRGSDTRCEVLVDGTAVALLPVSGIEIVHELNKDIPRVKLLLLADDISVQTLNPNPQRLV